MAYRISVILVLLFIACGDDQGSNTTKMDGAVVDMDGMMTTDDATTDSNTPTTDAGVGAACGTTTCTSAQECCLGNGGTSTCVATGTCQGVSFGCDGPEDCDSNEVCCYGNQGGGSGSPGQGGSECKMANQCQLNACHIDMDCSGTTSKCCAIGNTPYKVCLAQCPAM